MRSVLKRDSLKSPSARHSGERSLDVLSPWRSLARYFGARSLALAHGARSLMFALFAPAPLVIAPMALGP